MKSQKIAKEILMIAKDFVSIDAGAVYKKRQKDIDILMKEIGTGLKKHAKLQKEDPGNYGYEGDLGHVYAELVDLNNFLKRA